MNYPHDKAWKGVAPSRSDLHETSGLPHNWALDFMARGGTRIVVPELAKMNKLSGHDPRLGTVDPNTGRPKPGTDIFGWNVYLLTPSGIEYFITHMGNRVVKYLGVTLDAGTIIGHVGHWPHDEPRSHSHIGVNHPAGDTAAKNHICDVAAAHRVSGHWH